MKNIYQLARAGRRLQRYINGSLKLLTGPNPKKPNSRPKGITTRPLSEKQVKWHQARVMACHQSLKLLLVELTGRRVGGTAVRDARPLKIQRQFNSATI
jgi:hypothetical protein